MKHIRFVNVPRICWTWSVLCLVFTVGCGSDSGTIPVHGAVTLDGKPLSGGVITFQPVNVNPKVPNHTAQGTIMPDGTYSMSSFQANDGVLPGEYVVTVSPPPAPEAFDQFAKAQAAAHGPAIPAKYMDSGRTPLKATIPAGSGAQEINFEVKSH
jgi:hypothetical protein